METFPFTTNFQGSSELRELMKAYLIKNLDLQIDSNGHFKTANGVDIFFKIAGHLGDQEFNVVSINTFIYFLDTYLKVKEAVRVCFYDGGELVHRVPKSLSILRQSNLPIHISR